jgi:biopolymer transport protein ExbD
MRFSRRRKPHSGVEASSLSDILFFLLLFFLMISTLASPNAIKVLLPNANSGKTIPHKKVNLYIDATGNLFIEHDPVTLDALTASLMDLSKKDPDISIVVRADKSVTVEELVKVVDIANQQHIPLVVATEHTK